MKDSGEVFAGLVHIAEKHNVRIQIFPEFKAHKGRLKGNKIGLMSKLGIADLNYTLAHELAHFYLHYDKGDTIDNEKHSEYEEQADRAAQLLLDALAL